MMVGIMQSMKLPVLHSRYSAAVVPGATATKPPQKWQGLIDRRDRAPALPLVHTTSGAVAVNKAESHRAVDTSKGLRPILLAAMVGFVAGTLGGALGLGGGFLVVPALTSLFGIDPRIAIGTSSAVVFSVSCIACQAYISRGLASFRASAAIALSALITARIGATLTARAQPKALKRGFGGWLLLVSFLIGAKSFGLLDAGVGIPGAGEIASLPKLAMLGSTTGLLSGLLGVGGGTVLVPLLTLLFGFPQAEAQGCALLGMVPPSVVSLRTHWQKGNFDRRLAMGAVAGAVIGGWLGSRIAADLPEKSLRLVFAVVLTGVGAKYLRS